MDYFDLDFTKKAVFQPGTVKAFEYIKPEWISELEFEKSLLIDWWAANLCQISYRHEEAIKEELDDKAEFISGYRFRTQYAYTCKVHGQTFLVIQGSCTPEDNVLDIKFLKKKRDSVAYHRGFLEAADALWEMLEKVINENNGQVILCGHSLGGAIAQIIATRVNVKKLVTFGAPRVAGSEILDLIKSPYSRYVNCCDAVTMLPPKILGFSHAGETIFIDDEQKLYKQEKMLVKLRTSWRYFTSLNWCKPQLALTRSLTDHSPVNYCRAIARHLIENGLEK